MNRLSDLIKARVRRYGVVNVRATTAAWCWLDDARTRHTAPVLNAIIERAKNDTIARRITRADLERAERHAWGWHV